MTKQDVTRDSRDYYLSTRDLVTIAVLSAMGGVVSTYVGYLGKLLNKMVGVPFGAGQFMAGLHIFWIVVAFGLVRKPGSATLVGVLKGVVEMLTGSSHGAVIVVISALQGATFDGAMLPVRDKDGLPGNLVAAGLASATNVLVFFALYYSSFPREFIGIILALAFCSGIIFGGYFGRTVLENLVRSGVARVAGRETATPKGGWTRLNQAIAIGFVLAFSVGAIFYYTSVYTTSQGDGIEVTGDVANPFTYEPADFDGMSVTIEAEMSGIYTHEEPRNYTGVPLWRVLERASTGGGASTITIMASDGYSAELSLTEVQSNDNIIIVSESDGYRLVSSEHDASYWVRGIVEIRVG